MDSEKKEENFVIMLNHFSIIWHLFFLVHESVSKSLIDNDFNKAYF